MNKFRRRAKRKGEYRVSGAEIDRLVALASSSDPMERLDAANYLCPCHVRRRIDDVWKALFKLMEDEDLRVRKAAYHTLEDGGDLSEPGLVPIFERARVNETDSKLRKRAAGYLEARERDVLKRKDFADAIRARGGDYPLEERCDFCGEFAATRNDFETRIPSSDGTRSAHICASCDHCA